MYGRFYNFFIQINWLSAISVGFLLGVLTASFLEITKILIITFIFLSSFLLVIFFKNHYVKTASLALLFLVIGILYFGFQSDIPKDSKDYYKLQDQYKEIQPSHMNALESLKDRLDKGLSTAFLPPHSSLYKAIILGDKSEITYNMRNDLSRAGLSHIIAVSGMHIAIFTMIIFWVLLLFFKRRYAGLIALFILTFYVLMIGAPASAVRAAIMAGILISARFIGRPNSALRSLIYAAVIMVAVNPVIVKFDIGFQLSFLAVFGILIFYKQLGVFFQKIQYKIVTFIVPRPITKDRKLAVYFAEEKFSLTTMLAITLSAQMFTAPLVFYYFNIFSFVSPITNILVVPILPLALIFGFVAAIFGALNFLPVIFAAPAWLFSSYIWFVINVFS